MPWAADLVGLVIVVFIASFTMSLVFALLGQLLLAVFLALLAAVALGQLMMEDEFS